MVPARRCTPAMQSSDRVKRETHGIFQNMEVMPLLQRRHHLLRIFCQFSYVAQACNIMHVAFVQLSFFLMFQCNLLDLSLEISFIAY